MSLNESTVEDTALVSFKALGYAVAHGSHIAPGGIESERDSFSEVVLEDHPYTKIEFIERDLGVSRPTATKYLGALEQSGLVRKTRSGRTNFYVNEPLFRLLSQ